MIHLPYVAKILKRLLVVVVSMIIFLATTVFWVDVNSDIWNIVWLLSVVQMVDVWSKDKEIV